MQRQPLLDLIRAYAARYPGEGETIQRFEAFVHRCPDCFERSLEEGHVTGSAWLVDRDAENVLFTHHRKLNKWIQLGGHADGDPDISQVALREAIEESGLNDLVVEPEIFDLDIHPIPARKEVSEHFHYDVRFIVKHQGKGDFVVSDESHDLAWIPVHKIKEMTEEASILRMQRKWREEKGDIE